ncbi:hypothetical protein ABT275_33110 [Streptomyces sp. NPDC001185]|uniref:hypothetical protein n=1 Tax=Streptomyces sp. NPDC001185 TaxID=3154380 RepID=UPI00332FD341
MIEFSRGVDAAELAEILNSIVDLVLSEESDLLDLLSDGAQADFVVPLGMCAKMLSSGDYSAMELVSAANAVMYCAESHMSEFPDSLAQIVPQLPR